MYNQVKSKAATPSEENEKEPESRKIIQDFKSKKTWYEYLKDQLKYMQKMDSEKAWIAKMIKHLEYIIKNNLGIQFQSSFYFHGRVEASGLQCYPKHKSAKLGYEEKSKRHMSSQSMLIEDNTRNTSQDIHTSQDVRKKFKELGLDNTGLDDTGYETLQLEGDTFYSKISVVKQHLEREDHPLFQFISCFDQEFSEYYLIYLSNDPTKKRKCIIVIIVI